MDLQERFAQLADDAQYDLSCACGSKDSDRRMRQANGTWAYPASLPRGGKSIILKTLMSNGCRNDCKYCPLRINRDTVRRTSLAPDELARMFLDQAAKKNLHGLFLSSGVLGSPDATMERMCSALELIRRAKFPGFLHMKIIPGCSDAAIEAALSLASAVSINIEAPTANTFAQLTGTKHFEEQIIRPIKLISRLTARGARFSRVKQTTQFIVGAGEETDRQIVTATGRLYTRLHLERVYFSAYQGGMGDETLPGEHIDPAAGHDLLTREHRLYQVDYLLRRYRFAAEEIPFNDDDKLPLDADPKLHWAKRHPERFPIRLNRATKTDLLRVPGLGPTYVDRIIDAQRDGGLPNRRNSPAIALKSIGLSGKPLEKVCPWVIVE